MLENVLFDLHVTYLVDQFRDFIGTFSNYKLCWQQKIQFKLLLLRIELGWIIDHECPHCVLMSSKLECVRQLYLK